ncbi:hypothetical protein F5Y10DRAFT_236802 [Nemania abortiva]|nr:hypothetical protein F5Y10DRAFT_236802 [Nemania abortiva]
MAYATSILFGIIIGLVFSLPLRYTRKCLVWLKLLSGSHTDSLQVDNAANPPNAVPLNKYSTPGNAPMQPGPQETARLQPGIQSGNPQSEYIRKYNEFDKMMAQKNERYMAVEAENLQLRSILSTLRQEMRTWEVDFHGDDGELGRMARTFIRDFERRVNLVDKHLQRLIEDNATEDIAAWHALSRHLRITLMGGHGMLDNLAESCVKKGDLGDIGPKLGYLKNMCHMLAMLHSLVDIHTREQEQDHDDRARVATPMSAASENTAE